MLNARGHCADSFLQRLILIIRVWMLGPRSTRCRKALCSERNLLQHLLLIVNVEMVLDAKGPMYRLGLIACPLLLICIAMLNDVGCKRALRTEKALMLWNILDFYR